MLRKMKRYAKLHEDRVASGLYGNTLIRIEAWYLIPEWPLKPIIVSVPQLVRVYQNKRGPAMYSKSSPKMAKSNSYLTLYSYIT
jgi:hypothetical protein